MTRKLPLEGVHNARDFGDYPASGKRLKRGILFRTANHAEATDSDLDRLRALNLATIVDLRRPDERARSPSRRWAGFAARVVESESAQQMIEPWARFLVGKPLNAQLIHAYFVDYYTAAPFEPRHLDLFRRYFEALAEGGPILVHCTAGKDRTGMLAAFTLTLAGAHDDDVMTDFLETNDAETLDRRAPAIARSIAAAGMPQPSDDIARLIAGVAPEYLHAAFTAIEAKRGGLLSYLETDLGVDAQARARIAENLLA